MDITQLKTGLNKTFEQSRIVFWHDSEQSFTVHLSELDLLRDGQPVCILNMVDESQLQVRQRIEILEPEQAFLPIFGQIQNRLL